MEYIPVLISWLQPLSLKSFLKFAFLFSLFYIVCNNSITKNKSQGLSLIQINTKVMGKNNSLQLCEFNLGLDCPEIPLTAFSSFIQKQITQYFHRAFGESQLFS